MTVDYTKIGEQMSKTHKHNVSPAIHEPKLAKKETVYGEQPRKQKHVKEAKAEPTTLSFDPKTIPFGKKLVYGIVLLLCFAYPILFIPAAYFAYKTIKKFTKEAEQRHVDTVQKELEPASKLEIETTNPYLQNVLHKLNEHLPEDIVDDVNKQIDYYRKYKKQ